MWCVSNVIYSSVLNVKALVGALNKEKTLVGAFSVITNLRMDLFEALVSYHDGLMMDAPESPPAVQ